MEFGDGAAGDLTIVRPAAAAPPGGPAGRLRRARFFGTHAPRDKERERSSRKFGRESTT